MKSQYDVQKLIQFLDIRPTELKDIEVILKQKENIFYMRIYWKGNSFDINTARIIETYLDKVEVYQGPCAVVFVGMGGKIFSAGFDLKAVKDYSEQDSINLAFEFQKMAGRIQQLNCPTIALINGTAMAGGCIFAFMQDFRIMRSDKGIFELNEIRLGIDIPHGLLQSALLKTSNNTLERNYLFKTSKQYKPEELLKLKWVDKLVEPENIISETHKFAQEVAQFSENRDNYATLKKYM